MNTMNRDANNEAAQTLASMFAGTTIAKTSAAAAPSHSPSRMATP